VPNPTPQSGKKAVECPHCGFKQLESPFAKSTFCRKCSEHFELGKTVRSPRKERHPILARLGGIFAGKTTRDVVCFGCGARQVVSVSASSSLCPQCSAYLDLSDYKIVSTYSRSVETQGKFHITPKGDVTSAKIACGEARIEGKLRGALICHGPVRINFQGKMHGMLDVSRLVIEKKSELEMLRPIKARSVDIYGKVSGRFYVDGAVTIAKKGSLEGTLYAKSVKVEKGGVFMGELVIGSHEFTQPELLPEEPPLEEGGPNGPEGPETGEIAEPAPPVQDTL